MGGKSQDAEFSGLGNSVCHWGRGQPQHEVAEIIKSSFEHVEIEVCGSSQEREPIVIWMYCYKILQKGLGWATDQGEIMTMTNATKEVLSKKIIRG